MKVQLKEIISTNTAKLCRLPYPDHPKGCPNFGKKQGCPPDTPLWHSLVESPYWLVYQRFDLDAQEKRMLEKHPNWSKRQARCLLYWQKGVYNSVISEAISYMNFLFFLSKGEKHRLISNPEGAGIDLFETCRMAGIKLERDYLNQKHVYKMVLIGKKLKSNG